jgi:predicted RNA-binding protein YlqC (UPF0109 family)
MKAVVEVLVRALVDQPDVVEVTEEERRDTVYVQVRVAPGDVGKVIGKHGKIANAIRAVANAAAARDNMRVSIDIDS